MIVEPGMSDSMRAVIAGGQPVAAGGVAAVLVMPRAFGTLGMMRSWTSDGRVYEQ